MNSAADAIWGEGWKEDLAEVLAERGYASSEEYEAVIAAAKALAFEADCFEQALNGHISVSLRDGKLVFGSNGNARR